MSTDKKIVVTLKSAGEKQPMATGVSWSPTGNLIAFSSIDKLIHLHTATGELVAVLKGHSNWIGGVAWSPNGNLFASHSADGTVRLWHPASGTDDTGPWVSVRLKGHKRSVECLAWSHDGKILASGGEDKTVRLWAISQ